MRSRWTVALLASLLAGPVLGQEPRSPNVAPGWTIETVIEAPRIAFPTAVVAAPDGTVYLGQDPMDMPGPPTRPIDSVVAIRDGRVTTFAVGLWAVMGLEWADDTLYVVHAPFLSAFRDTNGDGQTDERVDLMTGLGPEVPGASGLNDHIAGGLRLGMDGFLYIAVGDKGIPKGIGRDGKTVQLRNGGLIRIRPDGTDLEVVSTGERNPLSVMMSQHDDLFTFGNDDDSKQWPNSLTHHVVGGHYGYPFEFRASPDRCLPILLSQFGGAGAQGVCYEDAGLPERYRGSLFVCDWGRQEVVRFTIEPQGASFRAERAETVVSRGDLADFRPFSIATAPDGVSFYLTDWAFNGWRADVPAAGRLFRLSYRPDSNKPQPSRPTYTGSLRDLDQPSRSIRMQAQRALTAGGAPPLIARLEQPDGTTGRIHALWALDRVGGDEASSAIRRRLDDSDATLRVQAARSIGHRQDIAALGGLIPRLEDPDATVRREAAIALGRLGEAEAVSALMARLGEPDPVVAWSVRAAIRRIGVWDEDALTDALNDDRKHDDAMKLATDAYAAPVVRALVGALARADTPERRRAMIRILIGQYRAEPDWDGRWLGPNSLAMDPPRKTAAWDRKAMLMIVSGLSSALADADPSVRREAVIALSGTGPAAMEPIRNRFPEEPDSTTLVTLIRASATLRDSSALPAWVTMLRDESRPLVVRLAAIEALETAPTPDSLKARFALAFDRKADPELVAMALAGLAKAGALPVNDLKAFFNHPDPRVRATALRSMTTKGPLSPAVADAVVARLQESDGEVRRAAASAAAKYAVRAALPVLIDAANDPVIRGEAIRALAAMPDPRAIDALILGLDDLDAETRRAAEVALRSLRDDHEEELERRFRSEALTGNARSALGRALTRHRLLADWQIIGPFPISVAVPILGQPAPDRRRPIAGHRWISRAAEASSGRILLDELRPVPGLDDEPVDDPSALAIFAIADLASDRERSAEFLFGSSGSLTVEINGRIVLDRETTAGRPFAADDDRVVVPLRKGMNRIVVRSKPGIGPWCFGVRVAEAQDFPIPSLPGTKIETLREFAMANPGDPRAGEALFFGERGAGCVRCHSVNGRGGATTGPDLAAIGRTYDRAELIRSVLEPSARIAPGYRPWVVAHQDGHVMSGRLILETPAELVLGDDQGRPVPIRQSEIVERRLGDLSTMPEGLVDALSPTQFADLIAYLAERHPGPAGSE